VKSNKNSFWFTYLWPFQNLVLSHFHQKPYSVTELLYSVVLWLLLYIHI
jgi:hypothetical protein